MADLNLNEDALLNTDKKCEDANAQAHKSRMMMKKGISDTAREGQRDAE